MIHEEKDYISNAKSDPKWKLDDGETKTENEEEIATRFKNFFVNKIEGLKEKIVFTNIFHFLVYKSLHLRDHNKYMLLVLLVTSY